MKNLFSTLFFACVAFTLSAQVPQLVNYQAVLRNNDGSIMSGEDAELRIIIREGNEVGTAVMTETHDVRSNQLGIVTIQIGSIETTAFDAIDWAANKYFLDVAVRSGGGNFEEIGDAQQILSVPYAIQAETAERATIPYASNYSTAGYFTTIRNEWIETEITVTVPESGNYLIIASGRTMSGTPDNAFFRIYNTTQNVELGRGQIGTPFPYLDQTATFTNVATLEKDNVLRLDFRINNFENPPATGEFRIIGDGSGGSSLSIIRLGN